MIMLQPSAALKLTNRPLAGCPVLETAKVRLWPWVLVEGPHFNAMLGLSPSA